MRLREPDDEDAVLAFEAQRLRMEAPRVVGDLAGVEARGERVNRVGNLLPITGSTVGDTPTNLKRRYIALR